MTSSIDDVISYNTSMHIVSSRRARARASREGFFSHADVSRFKYDVSRRERGRGGGEEGVERSQEGEKGGNAVLPRCVREEEERRKRVAEDASLFTYDACVYAAWTLHAACLSFPVFLFAASRVVLRNKKKGRREENDDTRSS